MKKSSAQLGLPVSRKAQKLPENAAFPEYGIMLALSTISSYKDDHLPEMEGLSAPGPQTLPLVKITN